MVLCIPAAGKSIPCGDKEEPSEMDSIREALYKICLYAKRCLSACWLLPQRVGVLTFSARECLDLRNRNRPSCPSPTNMPKWCQQEDQRAGTMINIYFEQFVQSECDLESAVQVLRIVNVVKGVVSALAVGLIALVRMPALTRWAQVAGYKASDNSVLFFVAHLCQLRK